MLLTLVLVAKIEMAVLVGMIPVLRVCRAHKHRVFGMCLYMLFQILRPFEGLSTKLTAMWFQRDMDANVRGNMVTFDNPYLTIAPCTDEIQVVRAFTPDVSITYVIL